MPGGRARKAKLQEQKLKQQGQEGEQQQGQGVKEQGHGTVGTGMGVEGVGVDAVKGGAGGSLARVLSCADLVRQTTGWL